MRHIKTPELLWPALRQYRHNTDNSPNINHPENGFVTGFDYDETVVVVKRLEQQLAELRAEIAGFPHVADLAAAMITTADENVKLKQQLAELRDAVAIYMESEGCSCCEGDDHAEHQNRIAALLNFPKYDDGSGYDYYVVAEAARLQENSDE